MKETISLPPSLEIIKNKLLYSIGADNNVKFVPLMKIEDNFFQDIIVKNDIKAAALASIIKHEYNLENVKLIINIVDNEGTLFSPQFPDSIDSLYDMLHNALYTNRYFKHIEKTGDKLSDKRYEKIGDLVIIFKKEIIQFGTDNISDLYNNYNEIASNLFGEVLNLIYKSENGTIKISTCTKNDFRQ